MTRYALGSASSRGGHTPHTWALVWLGMAYMNLTCTLRFTLRRADLRTYGPAVSRLDRNATNRTLTSIATHCRCHIHDHSLSKREREGERDERERERDAHHLHIDHPSGRSETQLRSLLVLCFTTDHRYRWCVKAAWSDQILCNPTFFGEGSPSSPGLLAPDRIIISVSR